MGKKREEKNRKAINIDNRWEKEKGKGQEKDRKKIYVRRKEWEVEREEGRGWSRLPQEYRDVGMEPGKMWNRCLNPDKRRYMEKGFRTIVLAILAAALFSGCGISEKGPDRVRNLEYTVTESEDLPEGLTEKMEQKKKSSFHFAYEDGEFMYLAIGYGEQKTGGYSIQIRDCYLSQEGVVVDTELIGPRKGEEVSEGASFPVIVLKLELRKENVIFR